MSHPSPVREHAAVTGASPFEAHDPSFAAVLGDAPRLVRVVSVDAHEGPVYVPAEDALYFTTLPRQGDVPNPGFPVVAIKRLALDGERFPLEPERVSVVVDQANMANGMTLDREGRLVVCEQGTPASHARISRLDPTTGRTETIVDELTGLRLNSPNDVVVKSDGSVWFTDPSYGHLQGFKPEPQIGDFVYRYDPKAKRLTVVADTFDKPNGLVFSPDESVLYVTDSGANQERDSFHVARPHHIVAFDVTDDGHLRNARLFAVTIPGFPDGIKVDGEGRVYASSSRGVQVFNPLGDLIGEIHLPGTVNFTFGGPGRNVLFITTDTAVWAAVLSATGVRPRDGKKGA
ncbi:MAG: SMP-30/gluconolactonase/LRE family protein [Actinomycetota bacterium]|jgi:gluconolactonase